MTTHKIKIKENVLKSWMLYLEGWMLRQEQCCGSGMFIPDPGSWFLPIPDPGSKKKQQKRGVKKICCHNFLCSHKFHKIANYFIFEVLKKKIWANFQRIIKLFTQNIVTKLSKIWIWDPGYGKNLFRIRDPGSRGQKGTGSRIRIRNTGQELGSLQQMCRRNMLKF